MALVELDGISKLYRTGETVVRAVRHVDLAVPEGQFLMVMGVSGSGKSTVLNILGMLDKPTTGTYVLQGTDVSTLSDDRMSEIRCRRIGIVFQSFNLFAQFSVLENVCVPLRYARYPHRRMHNRARELLGMVGLDHRVDHKPPQLSGGEKQRVAIARALANDPPLILADEPTGNLDEKTGDEVMLLLKNLVLEGRTVIMVTHNPAYEQVVDRVVRLHDGTVDEDRPARRAAAAGET